MIKKRRDLNNPPALNITKKGGFGTSGSHMDPKIDPNTSPFLILSGTALIQGKHFVST